MSSSNGWSGPDPAQLRLPPADVVEHTVELCGRLKEELVGYTRQPRLSKQFKAALDKAAGPAGVLDQSTAITAITAIDALILQKKQPDGTTIVRRFADQRRPAFSEEEKATLLRWQEVVEGCFEVRWLFSGPQATYGRKDGPVPRHATQPQGRRPGRLARAPAGTADARRGRPGDCRQLSAVFGSAR